MPLYYTRSAPGVLMTSTGLPTKSKLAKSIAERFSDQPRAIRALSDAVELRGQILARLRELRAAYAELGEKTYRQMKSNAEADPKFDAERVKMSIDGLNQEKVVLQSRLEKAVEAPAFDSDQ